MYIILAVIVFFVIMYFKDSKEDKESIRETPVPIKFKTFINELNLEAYNGNGRLHKISLNEYNLYEDGSNQIIILEYRFQVLTVTWKYKYYYNEKIYTKQKDCPKTWTEEAQKNIASRIILEMRTLIKNHKKDVDRMFIDDINRPD